MIERIHAAGRMSRTDLSGNKRTRERIDVFSDTICPWCWIGKRRLERTLEVRPDLDAEMVWHAFQLNPAMPVEGMDRKAYLDAKFGGADNARAVYGRVIAEGARESLPFDFGVIPRTPNTLDSHRLVRWAADQPLGQTPMVEALFDAYRGRTGRCRGAGARRGGGRLRRAGSTRAAGGPRGTHRGDPRGYACPRRRHHRRPVLHS